MAAMRRPFDLFDWFDWFDLELEIFVIVTEHVKLIRTYPAISERLPVPRELNSIKLCIDAFAILVVLRP